MEAGAVERYLIMPRIELDHELVEIEDCPECGRTVLCKSRAATGFLGTCGRRLLNLGELRQGSCEAARSAHELDVLLRKRFADEQSYDSKMAEEHGPDLTRER